MSFADPALAQMVAPVPEELLAGKLEKEQAAAAKGFRSFTRLETQERSLARKAQSKAPATKGLVLRPYRRVPAPAGLLPSRKIILPSVFQQLADMPLSEDGGNATWPPPRGMGMGMGSQSLRNVSAGDDRGALAGADRVDISAQRARQSKAVVQNLKEQLSVRAKNKGRGTPPPEAAGSNGTATPPLEDSAEPAFYPANMGALIKFGGPTVATLQAEIEQLNATQTQIKPSTTSERIGSLFTPGALIRTTQRNTKMVAKQVDKSYRRMPVPAVVEEDLAAEDRGVHGKDPALSHFLPLEEFDNAELADRDPEHFMCRDGGAVAKSKYYHDDGNYEWVPCRVLEYDEAENSFLIQWEHTQKLKWVKRFNLIFEGEDLSLWTQRVDEASQLRAAAEAEMRLWLYIDGYSDELVEPVDEEQLDRILSLVATEFPLVHLHCIERSITEMRAMYRYGVKKAIFEYKYKDPQEVQRLQGLNLPPVVEPERPPLIGTIDIEEHSFHYKCAYIRDNLFLAHRLLYNTVFDIVARWEVFANDLLCNADISTDVLPMELETFETMQAKVVEKITERLKEEWSVSITTTIQSDLDDQFNFYEDDILVYQQTPMCRFFRTINLIMTYELRSLILQSINAYVHFLEQFRIDDAHTEAVPPPDIEPNPLQIEDAADGMQASSSVMEDTAPTQIVTGNVPLFVVNITARDHGTITYEPELEEVSKGVRGVIDDMLNSTTTIKGVGDKLLPLLPLGDCFLPSVTHEDEEVQVAIAAVDQILQENMVGPRDLAEMYHEFQYLLDMTIEEHVEMITASDPRPSLEDFDKELSQLYSDIEKIRSTTLNEVAFKLLKVECYDIKLILSRKAHNVADAIIDALSKQCHEEVQAVDAAYQEMWDRIQTDPQTPEELEEHKVYCATCQGTILQLKKQFAEVERAVDLLAKYEYMFDDEDFGKYWLTFSWPKKVTDALENTESKAKDQRSRFQQELRLNTEQLTEDIKSLDVLVESFSSFADEARTEDYYLKIKEMQSKIKEYKDLVELYNSRETLFGLPTTQWSHINEITKAFEPYQQLWTCAYEFSHQYPSWHEGLFVHLDAEVVDQHCNTWSKTLSKLTKTLDTFDGPLTVCKSLLHKVEAFKPQLPLIQALRNPGLRDRHWKKISALVNHNVKPSEDMTLNSLVALNLLDHINDLQEISEYASKEYRLEKATEKMQAEWKTVQYELGPHRDTYVLRGVDDIQQLLDDHITKTQTMLGSPFVKAIESQVKAWEQKLLKMQAILDEWLRCQSIWSYLEPIFSSSDIQKSMPAEAQKFTLVNTMWHACIDATVKNPLVLNRCQEEKLLPNFIEANKLLDQILKQLQQFLETKRTGFPRFYFISNDELLEILSETKDPLLVQPYLKKCFEGIHKISFDKGGKISEMISGQTEVVPLIRTFHPDDHNNQVEVWLTVLETAMCDTIRDVCKRATTDFEGRPRGEWLKEWPGQAVLATCQMVWTKEVEETIREQGLPGLENYEKNCVEQMANLVGLVRGQVPRVVRCTLEALVVIEVHAKDIVAELVSEQVEDETSFAWLAQLRYYWESGQLMVRQTNACLAYGYEYLGNSGRLVITPLTDRCYRTLMGALHLNLGGAPEGPAGTGKTETTKDLAKAIAKQCVVYNCSDQISYREMAKLFKGLSSSGAWGCFDEFNRIEIQVLSVIAQQVLTIQIAIQQHKTEFLFEGQTVKLKPGCSVFITMNPGYAGRAELPDNLKALFRPVAMMVPDYALIAEISLFSFGFMKGRDLARKIVATYKLCSEQLSSQDHYDYGMRAVKAVLTAAGRLKRQLPDEEELIVVLRAIDDVNRPKFLQQDVNLFNGIISDLFPGVELPKGDKEAMLVALGEAGTFYNLQLVDVFMTKTFQIYEMVCVRHGVMVVGYSYSGKSSALNALARGLTTMAASGKEKKTTILPLNPKSVTMGQLYGQMDASQEWNDGILSRIFRNAANDPSIDRKWIVLDGPVDAIWIENMNTVLDDNKKLCLVNGDLIPMSDAMNMIFEVQDLAAASPATVSRCGMIYMEPESLGWHPLFESWCAVLPKPLQAKKSHIEQIRTIVLWLVEPLLGFVETDTTKVLPLSNNTMVASFLRLLSTFLDEFKDEAVIGMWNDQDLQMCIEAWILFCMIWSIGCNTDFIGRMHIHQYLGTTIGQIQDGAKKNEERPYKFLTQYPDKRLIYDYVYDRDELKWVDWMDTVENFKPPPTAQYHEIIVPTTDTVRYSYLLTRTILNGLPLLMVGETGTGKTILAKKVITSELDETKFQSAVVQFSAQTTSNHTQEIIESKLEKRRKGVFGPKIGKQYVIFIDDMNMPALEEYGAQPPIELLRQWMDYGGWYDYRKDSVGFKTILDILFAAGMGPTGGGRNPITPRLIRHFCTVALTDFDEVTMGKIFNTLADWILAKPGYPDMLRSQSPTLVQATLGIYDTIVEKLLPTPEKSHYTFNLRDVSKVFQGLSMAEPSLITNADSLHRLWSHECCRVFQDRLVDDTDRKWFLEVLDKQMHVHFKKKYSEVVNTEPLIYVDFLEGNPNSTRYEEVTELSQAKTILEDMLAKYNSETKNKMDLVVFNYVVEHVSRISRIIKLPYGHALLVGVGGSGRQSATRLAAYVADFKVFQVQLTKTYGREAWRDDMRALLKSAGLQGSPMVFLFTDGQCKEEAFIEDITSILNTGEIPNLFATDELDNIAEGLKSVAKEMGAKFISREMLLNLFVERSRVYLHVVLAFSPIGADLRNRLRKFPSLVNCCTIDWFSEWPLDGLRSVAQHFLGTLEIDPNVRNQVMSVCVYMHQSVRECSVKYLAEARQHNYVTPTSYLELITTFKSLLASKTQEVLVQKDRYEGGLLQLIHTEEEVEKMTHTLELLKPNLLKTAADTEQLIATIERESKEAEKTRSVVAVEEQECTKKAEAAAVIKEDCETQLADALPALQQAQTAVQDLDKKALGEVRGMAAPSDKIKKVIEAVCVMLEEAPKRVMDPATGKAVYDYWELAKKKVMANTQEFLSRLLNYDVENIKESVIEKIQPYIKDKNFKPSEVKNLSSALVGLCQWVIAVEKFYRANKIVKPKKEMLRQAEADSNAAMADLAVKQAALKEVDDQLAALKDDLEVNMKKKQELEEEYANTESKLVRATKLMSGLGGEKTRYIEQSKYLRTVFEDIVGDVLVSAGMISYLGPYTSKYRSDLCADWLKECQSKEIPCSSTFELSKFLGDPVKIQEWKLLGLPSDPFSVDNAIIVTTASRWPLLLDPQGQANNWVKNLERDNRLMVVRPTEGDFQKSIMQAIRTGCPALLENVDEEIDPVLEPLLLKQVFRDSGTLSITLGDTTVEYNESFRFYMTTKLPRPHYKPEISTKVALINFVITPAGLQDQLLQKVVAFEERELEEKKQKYLAKSAQNKAKLKAIEDEILRLLSAEGNLLENEEVINTLDSSKVVAKEISAKQVEIENFEVVCDKTRNKFLPVSVKAATLFFVTTDMANIDPMYQWSLQWYIDLFNKCLRDSEPSPEDRDKRILNINEYFQYALYKQICRSLFAKDKLLFSFLMCIKVLGVDQGELRFFMTGGVDSGKDVGASPATYININVWKMVCRASDELEPMQKLSTSLKKDGAAWQALFESEEPHTLELPHGFTDLAAFQRLLVLRIVRPDKLILAIADFVSLSLSERYIQPPLFNLAEIWKDCTDPWVPLVFILSAGADPMAEVMKFAGEEGMLQKLEALSLGQGQGERAKEKVLEGKQKGLWIMLQNCHLYSDWMPSLQRIVEGYSSEELRGSINKAFRLWLTCAPSDKFPVSILQNGVKMIVEPPKGLQANLLRSFTGDPLSDANFYGSCNKPDRWKKLVFGLCFFHAVIQERRSFGPLGWNIPYEFNQTDLVISIRQLLMFINENAEVPYEALTYLVGHCNYGGRVTDDHDRRCLLNLLNDYFTEKIMSDEYTFSPSGIYYAPPDGEYDEYVTYIQQLPSNQKPEVFGLHANANITKDELEASRLLQATMSTQGSQSGGSGGDAGKGVVKSVAENILSKITGPFDTAAVSAKYPIMYEESMNTVLTQELIRYNRLIKIVIASLKNLIKAIRGEVLMSSELEGVFNAIYDGRIPPMWAKKSYPSLKPLGAYVVDLVNRIEFFNNWIDHGPPAVFWLSGFFFTQSFLTGVLQNYARKFQIEIDTLKWDFTVMKDNKYQKPPTDGCYFHGLFLQGCAFDAAQGVLCESEPKILFTEFPIVWLMPMQAKDEKPAKVYEAPLYKTSERRGVLSTTGHSTNFVMRFKLPTVEPPEHWVKRGVALLCQLDY